MYKMFRFLFKKELVYFYGFAIILMQSPSIHANDFVNKHELELSSEIYITDSHNTPFWIKSNRNGIFTDDGISTQFIGIEFNKKEDDSKKWDFTYGGLIYANLDYQSAILPVSYWAELKHKKIIFSLGAKPDPLRFNGLSSTNANILRSNNARPMPHIGFKTDGFIDLIKKLNLSFKALYEENFLFDDRFVDNPMVHHKYFYLRYKNKKGWSLTAGLDHFVFWGGTSPVKGKLPGFKNYADYVFARQGGEDSPVEDQLNIAGNQMGNYIVEFGKEFKTFSLTIYLNHFFEDGSGKSFKNFGDGLIGIAFINKKDKRPIQGIVLEYISTMDQSGSTHFIAGDEDPGASSLYGNDDYFNNVIYKSGFTHYNNMMGLPFITPIINENGISTGFNSNRIKALHLGMNGCINDRLQWKTLLSKYHHYGTHSNPFTETIKTFSFLVEIDYRTKWDGLGLKFYIASDLGELIKNSFGTGFSINYKIF